jgi:hypothetical protein
MNPGKGMGYGPTMMEYPEPCWNIVQFLQGEYFAFDDGP